MVSVVEGVVEGEWAEFVELVFCRGVVHLSNVRFMRVSCWSGKLRDESTSWSNLPRLLLHEHSVALHQRSS